MTNIEQLNFDTTEAINAAGRFADPLWYSEAESAVAILAKIGSDFTTDEVSELLYRKGLTTKEPRALGAIMRQASKDGLIRSTGRYRQTIRPEAHRRPKLIWHPINYKRTTREAE